MIARPSFLLAIFSQYGCIPDYNQLEQNNTAADCYILPQSRKRRLHIQYQFLGFVLQSHPHFFLGRLVACSEKADYRMLAVLGSGKTNQAAVIIPMKLYGNGGCREQSHQICSGGWRRTVEYLQEIKPVSELLRGKQCSLFQQAD